MLSSAILKSNGTDQRVTEIETLKLKDLVKDVKNRKQETLHSSGRRSQEAANNRRAIKGQKKPAQKTQ